MYFKTDSVVEKPKMYLDKIAVIVYINFRVAKNNNNYNNTYKYVCILYDIHNNR